MFQYSKIKNDIVFNFTTILKELPNKYGCWNCGMIKTKNGYNFLGRNEISKWNPIQKDVPGYKPLLIKLDNDFQFLDFAITKMQKCFYTEDVRYLSEGEITGTTMVGNVPKQFYALINEEKVSLSMVLQHPGVNKNWISYKKDGVRFFLQSVFRPRTIYRGLEVKKYSCEDYGGMHELRGNVSIDIGDYFLDVYHKHSDRFYGHVFALINKEDLSVDSVSKTYRFHDSHNIEFVMGLVKNGNDLFISYGVGDTTNLVSKIDFNNIEFKKVIKK